MFVCVMIVFVVVCWFECFVSVVVCVWMMGEVCIVCVMVIVVCDCL